MTTTQTIERCRSCDGQVVFVPSATTGKPMILDAKPRKGVVVTIAPTEHGLGPLASRATVRGETLPAPSASVVDVYTDHHATCPDAASWKGKHR